MKRCLLILALSFSNLIASEKEDMSTIKNLVKKKNFSSGIGEIEKILKIFKPKTQRKRQKA